MNILELGVKIERKMSYIYVVCLSTERQSNCLWRPGPWESIGGYKSACTWTWREEHLSTRCVDIGVMAVNIKGY
jgi:hypothetical protein